MHFEITGKRTCVDLLVLHRGLGSLLNSSHASHDHLPNIPVTKHFVHLFCLLVRFRLEPKLNLRFQQHEPVEQSSCVAKIAASRRNFRGITIIPAHRVENPAQIIPGYIILHLRSSNSFSAKRRGVYAISIAVWKAMNEVMRMFIDRTIATRNLYTLSD